MLEEEIKQFDIECKVVKNRQFQNFNEFETVYCDLINKCLAIRKYILKNPTMCNENTYKILSNQSKELDKIEPKYKCLLNIIDLKSALMQNYKTYVKELMQKQDYKTAMNVYKNMFFFTHDYYYKKEIANLYLREYNDFTSCFSIYKECEPHLADKSYFWFEFSEVYRLMRDYFNQVKCMQKAINIEMKGFESSNG